MARAGVSVLNQVRPRVNAKARGRVVCRIVFVGAASRRGSPAVVLPFILCRDAASVCFLVCHAIMSPRVIFRFILVGFRSNDGVEERRGAFAGTMGVL